ncbi:S9 family peptidase [Oceanobacillus jeddahense]|uniref:S9 family peptidase n=1 Tax=Oceanobacillus jeddahense TaxID=1462527 RepID=A0ABY5JLE6_9BACI|nr:S9 family peptidase [Oceanobacillus jeddahense]UUI01130.1 S9 family peptidase [Oceanobacillus jeddahense]
MSNHHANYLTIEEIIALPTFQDVSISEDGQRVAYVRSTTDWDNNTYPQHVWIYDKHIDKNYPLTIGENESMQPCWSPDGQILAFLSPVDDGDKKIKQIFIQTNEETTAIQLSHANHNIYRFKWAPDGQGLFFTAKRPEPDKLKRRSEMYGDFTYVDQDFHFNALYFLDLEKGKQHAKILNKLPKDLREEACENGKDNKDKASTPLTELLDRYIYHFDISPDSKKVIFSSAPTPRFTDLLNMETYLLDLETDECAKLDITPLQAGPVLFSYDGSKICYSRYRQKKIYANVTLEIYDLKTKQTKQPALDIDENVFPVRWTTKGIHITWLERTNYITGLITEDGTLTPLADPADIVITHPSITSDGKHTAYVKATSQTAAEVFLDNQQLTKQYMFYEGKTKSKKEIISWQTEDGLEIEGILSKPADYDDTKTYPLVLAVHGGPTGISLATPTTNRYQPIEQFIEKGFLVLEPNYRGSAGYGEAFRAANFRQLGLGDYKDIISGVDLLIDSKIADPEKVGILGWSQGGYISAFCATYSNRFKAISVGAGISNWMTYYVNTDITHFTRYYLGDTPWNDEKIYRNTSPMTYINNASTPTLIQHGEKDPRVPVPNAYELYRGLKDVGVETELVIFKDMLHGSDKPGIHRAILKQNLDWFAYHILDEQPDEGQVY